MKSKPLTHQDITEFLSVLNAWDDEETLEECINSEIKRMRQPSDTETQATDRFFSLLERVSDDSDAREQFFETLGFQPVKRWQIESVMRGFHSLRQWWDSH